MMNAFLPCARLMRIDQTRKSPTMMACELCRHLLWAVLGLLLAATAPLAAHAEASDMDAQTRDVLARIKAVEATLRTFEAKFHQIQKSRLFEEIVESRGVIYYSADGKLRFSLLNPSPLTVLMEGEWLTIHDPESGRTQRHHMGSRQNMVKSFLGVGQPLDRLNERFDVHAVANAPLPGYTLTMAPKKSLLAKKVRRITAMVDGRTWLPQQVVIQQSEEEWSRMDLEFVSVNESLPAGAFALDFDKAPKTGNQSDR